MDDMTIAQTLLFFTRFSSCSSILTGSFKAQDSRVTQKSTSSKWSFEKKRKYNTGGKAASVQL